MSAHPDLTQSNLWQIDIPEDCISKTFEDLFLFLLEKKLVTIALYRQSGATDNLKPYVYTNPDKNTVVSHRDRCFVLGVDIPEEL